MEIEAGKSSTPGGNAAASASLASEFSAFSKATVNSMKEISEFTDQRASTVLLTIGTFLLILVMFLRLRPLGLQVSDLGTSEFIAMLLVGSLFILSGSLLRLYHEHVTGAVAREIRASFDKDLERLYELRRAQVQSEKEPKRPGI